MVRNVILILFMLFTTNLSKADVKKETPAQCLTAKECRELTFTGKNEPFEKKYSDVLKKISAAAKRGETQTEVTVQAEDSYMIKARLSNAGYTVVWEGHGERTATIYVGWE